MTAILSTRPSHSQLLQYFSTYLGNINQTITQVKKLVYSLIDMPITSIKHSDPSIDIPYIMSTCKRTLDDMKRIESVLKGHLKVSHSQSDRPYKIISSKRQEHSKQRFRTLPQDNQKQTQKIRQLYGSQSEIFAIPLVENEYQTKSTRTTQNKQIIQVQQQSLRPKEQNGSNSYKDSEADQWLASNQKIRSISMRMQYLRQKQQTSFQTMTSDSERCLQLLGAMKKKLLRKKKQKQK